ncbi:MAG: SGNH/GDSL hydrolase family protein, partial [Planctomycetes bacterium]|nr:SGNH/GDSL hydrolase family protein [Planctomycetota bacterium]
PAPIVAFARAVAAGQPAPALSPGTPFGYDYAVPRAGLDRCRQRFVSTGRGRVAFLGGSITQASGWRELVQGELRARFAGTDFAFIDAGVASLGSTPHAFRYGRDVIDGGPVDLLFVEAAVNDAVNGMSDLEQLRGMEGVVRQARLADPAIDIVILHFADPDKLHDIRAGRRPAVIANHERVAEHYSVSSIDLAQEVAERIAAEEFTWEADFRDLHPEPFGHRLYAASVARLFAVAWADPPVPGEAPVVPRLPEPLDPASYFRGRLLSPDQAGELIDWRLDPNWGPNDGAPTRPGFVEVPALVAERPGATLTLRFTGRAIGLFVTSGPDAGAVEFAIDGVPQGVRDLFTPWSAQLHLPWAVMLTADLEDGAHLLTLRVAPSANPDSRGHAVRIVHFLVN